MACGACQKARQNVVQNLSSGNMIGAARAMTAGAVMVAEKLAGVDINKKYGTSSTPNSQPYSRE